MDAHAAAAADDAAAAAAEHGGGILIVCPAIGVPAVVGIGIPLAPVCGTVIVLLPW